MGRSYFLRSNVLVIMRIAAINRAALAESKYIYKYNYNLYIILYINLGFLGLTEAVEAKAVRVLEEFLRNSWY
ncbi:hypothetical protein BCE02nite_50700 [Brevibacillus centrosporus]|nr:hypothetical protein BCE02nite_50700 [Brevibacillus centrosporus]